MKLMANPESEIIRKEYTNLDKNIKEAIIPYGFTEIGEYAFSKCLSLTNITIPNSVTEIGWSAFSKCSSLKNITIPDSVTSIGEYTF